MTTACENLRTERERAICRGEDIRPDRRFKYLELWVKKGVLPEEALAWVTGDERRPPPPVPEPRMRGMGDLVRKVTDVTGIHAGVKKVADLVGVDCGCDKRQEWLNAVIPFGKTEDDPHSVLAGPRPTPFLPRAARPLGWAYGVTTVQGRFDTTLPRTLASLSNAGFDRPRLFVDGLSTPDKLPKYVSDLGLEATLRSPTVGAFGNWMLSLWELYVREPKKERYAIFQDDAVFCRGLRGYLDSSPYPDKGYLNLFTFMQNEGRLGPTAGWYDSNQLGRGAVALVFDRDAVVALLTARNLIDKPASVGPKAKPTSNIDGAVSDAMRNAGRKEYVHGPSLCQHIGDESAIGNKPHPKALTFPGEQFDAAGWLLPD